MKVTKEFRIVTGRSANHKLPTIGWKVSLDGTQLGEVWWWPEGDDGAASDADNLAMVLKQAAKDIKYYQKHGKKRK